MIRPSLSIIVFDFHEGTCPQASHLSSAQIAFFIIIAAQNNGIARWLMPPFMKLYFSYDSLNNFNHPFSFALSFLSCLFVWFSMPMFFTITSCGLMFLLRNNYHSHDKPHVHALSFFFLNHTPQKNIQLHVKTQ